MGSPRGGSVRGVSRARSGGDGRGGGVGHAVCGSDMRCVHATVGASRATPRAGRWMSALLYKIFMRSFAA